jgi:transcriptional regulator with XRE-family HTH domain
MVRALRGRRSQTVVSKGLGYKTNATYRWERAERQPRASDFFRLAGDTGIDVPAVLARFAPGSDTLPKRLDASAIGRWLQNLTAEHTTLDLARTLDRNRNTVSRWLEGKTEPRLDDVLRIVDLLARRLVDFVAAFTDPEQLFAVRPAHALLAEQRRTAYRYPWSRAVFRTLELESYRALRRHQEGFIAEHLGISLEEERDHVWGLVNARQIKKRALKLHVKSTLPINRSDERRGSALKNIAGRKRRSSPLERLGFPRKNLAVADGKVAIVDGDAGALETLNDPKNDMAVERHWASVGVERIGRALIARGGLVSYELLAVDDEALGDLRNAHAGYLERVRAIAAASKKRKHVVLVNAQLTPLARSRTGGAA